MNRACEFAHGGGFGDCGSDGIGGIGGGLGLGNGGLGLGGGGLGLGGGGGLGGGEGEVQSPLV